VSSYLLLLPFVNGCFRGDARNGLIRRATMSGKTSYRDEDVGAIRNLVTTRSVAGADQSRTAVGTALGCVVPRRPCALGYLPAAAGSCAFGIRGGFAERCSMRAAGRRDALHIASLGLKVLGVDVAELRWRLPRESRERRIAIRQITIMGSRLSLPRLTPSSGALGRRFETVLDCGLFSCLRRDASEHNTWRA